MNTAKYGKGTEILGGGTWTVCLKINEQVT